MCVLCCRPRSQVFVGGRGETLNIALPPLTLKGNLLRDELAIKQHQRLLVQAVQKRLFLQQCHGAIQRCLLILRNMRAQLVLQKDPIQRSDRLLYLSGNQL